MLLRDSHALVPEQDRNLVNGHAGQQHLDRECIAEHMREAPLRRSIGFLQLCQREQPPVAALPVGYGRLGKSIATPEEISRIWLWPWRYRPHRLGDFWRKRHVDWRASLCLIEEQVVPDKPCLFECDGIADAQATPTHEERQGAQARAVVNARFGAVLAIGVRRVDDSVELLAREVIGGRLIDADATQTVCWILCDPPGTDAEPEKSSHPLLFFLLCQSAIFPGRAKGLNDAQIHFPQEFVAFGLRPLQQLLIKNDVELVQRGFAQLAGLRIGKIFFDRPLNGDRLFFFDRIGGRIVGNFDFLRQELRALPTVGFQTVSQVVVGYRALHPHGARAAFPIAVGSLRTNPQMAAIERQHDESIVHLSYTEEE